MDNTTKKVLQFFAKIIRWQIKLSVGVLDLKSKELLDHVAAGNFSDFEENGNTSKSKAVRIGKLLRDREAFFNGK